MESRAYEAPQLKNDTETVVLDACMLELSRQLVKCGLRGPVPRVSGSVGLG